jgi:hypothetical protein
VNTAGRAVSKPEFCTIRPLLYAEEVDAEMLDDALDSARATVDKRYPDFVDSAVVGYVILDDRRRLVARGYKRGLGRALKAR